MPSLRAFCNFEDCDELVDADSVWDHMANQHGALSPKEWKLKSWPDGESVLLNPEEFQNGPS